MLSGGCIGTNRTPSASLASPSGSGTRLGRKSLQRHRAPGAEPEPSLDADSDDHCGGAHPVVVVGGDHSSRSLLRPALPRHCRASLRPSAPKLPMRHSSSASTKAWAAIGFSLFVRATSCGVPSPSSWRPSTPPTIRSGRRTLPQVSPVRVRHWNERSGAFQETETFG